LFTVSTNEKPNYSIFDGDTKISNIARKALEHARLEGAADKNRGSVEKASDSASVCHEEISKV
jgi:hypothetical protein